MTFTPRELTWLGVAKESVWGTAVDPTYFVPHKDAKPEDVIEAVKDQGIRGAMAMTYNVLQGVKHSTMDISGEVFPDSIGVYLLSLLGTDTVTGTGPYTHTFKLARTSQPPSLTHSRYDGTNMRQFAGHMGEELTVKFSKGGALEYTFKSQGKSSAVATTATPTTTTTLPLLGWEASVTLGGIANLNLVGFDFSLKRKLYVQHAANNSQDPTAIVALGLEATGKATFDKADDTELSDFLSNTQPALVITLTQPTSGYQLVFQITKCAFIKDPVTAKEVVQGDVEFDGVDNTTDLGPALVKLTNGVATY